MRKIVIEHNIIGRESGDRLPAVVCDGADWGDDFENFCSPNPEEPSTFWHDEGFNQKTQQWVTYDQTFLITEKSNEELLKEYV